LLTRAVAKALHKLMAYKDEYEVARLYSNGDFIRQLNETFEGDFKLQFHMAPPLLSKKDPDTGLPRKMQFSSWMMPLFGVLAKFKALRGTRFDLFGYSAERHLERELLRQFETDIDELTQHLSADKLPLAVELVELIQQVRGFGHIKEAAIEQYQLRREHIRKKLRGDVVQMVEIESAA